MTAQTNLPSKTIQDSAARTKLFFDTYGETPLEFNAVDVDSTVGFFQKRGFSDDASQTLAMSLLKQAKLEAISVQSILDTIKNFDDSQIGALVSEVLNNNRPATSTLGYRQQLESVSKQRNVVP
jgi:ADP-ribosylglycohydrolase